MNNLRTFKVVSLFSYQCTLFRSLAVPSGANFDMLTQLYELVNNFFHLFLKNFFDVFRKMSGEGGI